MSLYEMEDARSVQGGSGSVIREVYSPTTYQRALDCPSVDPYVDESFAKTLMELLTSSQFFLFTKHLSIYLLVCGLTLLKTLVRHPFFSVNVDND